MWAKCTCNRFLVLMATEKKGLSIARSILEKYGWKEGREFTEDKSKSRHACPPVAKYDTRNDDSFIKFVDTESELDPTGLRKIKKDVLEDLQFSSDEEEEEDIPLSDGELMPDGSQQAAEAMVQLGNMSYFPQTSEVHQEHKQGQGHEESINVDPNYDPSDFLIHDLPQQRAENQIQIKTEKITDDLEVEDDDVAGDLWF